MLACTSHIPTYYQLSVRSSNPPSQNNKKAKIDPLYSTLHCYFHKLEALCANVDRYLIRLRGYKQDTCKTMDKVLLD
jgi:hypothetical protein